MRGDSVITLREAAQLMGFKENSLKKLFRDAKLTRVGKNYWKVEVMALIEVRSVVLNTPRSEWVGGWREKYSAICHGWKRFIE